MSMAPTPKTPDLALAVQLVKEMTPVKPGDIIPLLQKIQDIYGYVPREIVLAVCEQTGLPPSRVYGAVTFYKQFYLEPRGRHIVRCCRGTACHVRGARRLLDTVVKTLGIRDGETTPDFHVSLETVACLGACALSPVLVVDNTYYGKMTPRRADEILRRLMEKES